jgi:hypothetical protein
MKVSGIGFLSRPLLMHQRTILIWSLLGVAAPLFIGAFLTPFKGAATATYLILLVGILHRQQRNLHAALMSIGIVFDFSLVLVLEWQRSAIETVAGGHLNSIQVLHVVCSLLAVIFYIPVAILGMCRFRGTLGARGKALHLRLGIWAFSLRTTGYFLMFSMVGGYT